MSDSKAHNLCDSTSVIFWKIRNYRVTEEVSDSRGQGKRMPTKGGEGIWGGNETVLWLDCGVGYMTV